MLGFWSIGFGLAYQRGAFLGTSGERFFLQDYTNYIDFFFQSTFAVTVASIVVGTIVTSSTSPGQHFKMIGCILYSFFLTAFVYPVIAHTIWNDDGFLSAFSDDPRGGVGMIDFAGSGVVHVTSGATALVAAIILRRSSSSRSRTPCISTNDAGRNPTSLISTTSSMSFFLPHCSILLQVLGTFAVWIGWYGFNAGSTLSISPPGYGDAAALCAVTTTLSATCGGISCMCFDAVFGLSGRDLWRKPTALNENEGHHDNDVSLTTRPFVEYDISMALKGCLSGLVSITGCSSVVEPWAACIIGCVSGILYILSSNLIMMKFFKVRDTMGTISIHLFNGIWGCIATGIFASPRHVANAFGFNAHYSGLLYVGSSNGTLFVNEILGIVIILAWTIGTMTLVFLFLLKMGMLIKDDYPTDIAGSSYGENHHQQGGEGETEMLTKCIQYHDDDDHDHEATPENDNYEENENHNPQDKFIDDQSKIV
jgi:Amt family ammonium transporter